MRGVRMTTYPSLDELVEFALRSGIRPRRHSFISRAVNINGLNDLFLSTSACALGLIYLHEVALKPVVFYNTVNIAEWSTTRFPNNSWLHIVRAFDTNSPFSFFTQAGRFAWKLRRKWTLAWQGVDRSHGIALLEDCMRNRHERENKQFLDNLQNSLKAYTGEGYEKIDAVGHSSNVDCVH